MSTRLPRGPLPGSARVRKRSEYLRLRAQGSRLRQGPLRLQWSPNGGPVTRVGITVPKFDGSAPLRNRIKRVLREAWRTVRDDFPIGLDLVIIVDAAAPCTKFAEVVALLESAARQIRRRA